MSDLDALLRAILLQPAEDVPRLAYADALDERGGPGDAERGWFVRHEIGIHRAGGSSVQYVERTESKGIGMLRHWMRADLEFLCCICPWTVGYTRGFVFHIELFAADFLKHAKAIFCAHPVTSVLLTDKSALNVADLGAPGRYWWIPTERDTGLMRWELPRSLWHESLCMEFATSDDADAQLSRRCVAYGREQAGLTAHTEVATA